jgi:hypothetical protein
MIPDTNGWIYITHDAHTMPQAKCMAVDLRISVLLSGYTLTFAIPTPFSLLSALLTHSYPPVHLGEDVCPLFAISGKAVSKHNTLPREQRGRGKQLVETRCCAIDSVRRFGNEEPVIQCVEI